MSLSGFYLYCFGIPICLRGMHISRPHYHPQHSAVPLNCLSSTPEIQGMMWEEEHGEEKKEK